MTGVLGFFATVLGFKQIYPGSIVLGMMAAGFLFAGTLKPESLAGIHTRWMRFAEVLGAFNSKLILGLIYIVFFTLLRAILTLFRIDPLNRKIVSDRDSYWENHEPMGGEARRYHQQF
ncbi:MAG: hypothetical protein COV67_05005 [Nitrospinae bacterium CG11_big_fil_rev_8_21_14_0_20_56_8]|nr:MAG: hypothetical protein COV67_05005 [Nitrospinae bacterium CG11_big_fil_rev_8_21_14_0_20_56_8]